MNMRAIFACEKVSPRPRDQLAQKISPKPMAARDRTEFFVRTKCLTLGQNGSPTLVRRHSSRAYCATSYLLRKSQQQLDLP